MKHSKKIISGVMWHQSKFQRIDVPFSMVVEWCIDQFGPGHRWPIAWHDPIDTFTWSYDGGNFYFRNENDKIMFDMRWS